MNRGRTSILWWLGNASHMKSEEEYMLKTGENGLVKKMLTDRLKTRLLPQHSIEKIISGKEKVLNVAVRKAICAYCLLGPKMVHYTYNSKQ